jgi:hypothetical protein
MSKFRDSGTSVVVWGAPCDYAITMARRMRL